jgi:hypothetical protein
MENHWQKALFLAGWTGSFLNSSCIINSDLHDAAVHHHSRLQGQSERLSEPCFTDASGSPGDLSRVGSLLSSYYYSRSSEQPFSMSNVSARVQSWRKFRPANSFAHAESQVSSKWKNMVQDEEAAFKGSDLGSAPSKCCLRCTSLVLWLCMTMFSTAVLLAVTCLLY